MKKLISLILIFTMCLSLVACSKSDTVPDDKETPETITVVDMEGLEVEIPADTKHNTVASNYGVITPFFVTLQMSDRVLATTIKNKGFMRKVDETILKTGDIGSFAIDSEALATLSPSILVTRTSGTDKKEAGLALGIPTVGVYIESADQVKETYILLGKCFGCEERATEIVNFIDGQIKEIEELAKTIPDDKKVTAICLGTMMGQLAGADMLQCSMIKFAGGISVVEEVPDNTKWFEAGVEKIFDYNPDFIFVTSSAPLEYKLSNLYEENAWSGMKAVQNDHLCQIPARLDSWDMPGPAFILGTCYMMHCMYPDVMTSEMLQERIDNFYDFFYGITFTGEELGYNVD